MREIFQFFTQAIIITKESPAIRKFSLKKKKRSHVPFKQNDFEKSSPLIAASIKDQQN